MWPWKAAQRHRCLIPVSGFWEPEKLAREKGVAPWSYYSMTDGRPFFMAGLWAEASDPTTGEVADTYTLIITGDDRVAGRGRRQEQPDRATSRDGGADHHLIVRDPPNSLACRGLATSGTQSETKPTDNHLAGVTVGLAW